MRSQRGIRALWIAHFGMAGFSIQAMRMATASLKEDAMSRAELAVAQSPSRPVAQSPSRPVAQSPSRPVAQSPRESLGRSASDAPRSLHPPRRRQQESRVECCSALHAKAYASCVGIICLLLVVLASRFRRAGLLQRLRQRRPSMAHGTRSSVSSPRTWADTCRSSRSVRLAITGSTTGRCRRSRRWTSAPTSTTWKR